MDRFIDYNAKWCSAIVCQLIYCELKGDAIRPRDLIHGKGRSDLLDVSLDDLTLLQCSIDKTRREIEKFSRQDLACLLFKRLGTISESLLRRPTWPTFELEECLESETAGGSPAISHDALDAT
jgi:hypothetical protein